KARQHIAGSPVRTVITGPARGIRHPRSSSPTTRSRRPNWHLRWRSAASTCCGRPSTHTSRFVGAHLRLAAANWRSATTMSSTVRPFGRRRRHEIPDIVLGALLANGVLARLNARAKCSLERPQRRKPLGNRVPYQDEAAHLGASQEPLVANDRVA